MKQMLVLEKEEKEAIKNACAIMQDYCDEQCGCDGCPLDPLCSKIYDKDRELTAIEVMNKVVDTLC